MSLSLLEKFKQPIQACRSLDDLRAVFEILAESQGAHHYVWVFGNGAGEMIVVCNRPSHWMETYMASNWFGVDPIVNFAMENPRCFTWTEAMSSKRQSANAKLMMAKAAEIGMVDGICCPQEDTVNNRSSFSLIFGECAKAKALYDEHKSALTQLSWLIHLKTAEISSLREVSSALTLSARELEVLKFCAEGFSINECAERLKIGTSTVKKHRESAMAKLGANNITHAVSIAMQLELIKPILLVP